MPLQIPERREVIDGLRNYTRTALPNLDPTTQRRSYVGGMVKALGSALHDWFRALKTYADKEPFPQTATDGFLFHGWWADITKLSRLPAAGASGIVVVTGQAGKTIPQGTTFDARGVTYEVDTASIIANQSLNIASLTRDGDTAIAETTLPHQLATGMTVQIAGADQSEYNVSAEITVTAENEFTYEVAGSPATPATGLPKLSAAYANVAVTATTTGRNTNVDSGGSVAFSTPLTDVDSTARVTFGGLRGGTEIEDAEDFRDRILEALGTDFGMFSAAEIKIIAQTVPGVTDVFVRQAQLWDEANPPEVTEGQVEIAFLRRDDANPIPSANEVEKVRQKILTILPAHTADEDVTVFAPTRLDVDFTFDSISPDTVTMRRAIRNQLDQFFEEGVTFGTAIAELDWKCAIKETYDTEARQKLKSFSVSSPAGDIAVDSREFPFLGNVTFS